MLKLFSFLFLFFFTYSSYTQSIDSLFYGDVPAVLKNPYGWGYIAGTNHYGDIGKYQRFDVLEDIYITGTRIYFGHLDIVGTPDALNVVVRGAGTQGEPADILSSKNITTDLIQVGLEGVFVQFDSPVFATGYLFDPGKIFIGIEWQNTIDDTFAVFSDTSGLGEMANRAWERFDDGTFNDFLPLLFFPDFSWNIDVDLWIKAYYTTTAPSGINVTDNPYTFELMQNHPNPFNPGTTISYSIQKDAHVMLTLYDLMGREIAKLVDENKNAGSYSMNFNASDYNLSSGAYFYRIQTEGFTALKKMIFLK